MYFLLNVHISDFVFNQHRELKIKKKNCFVVFAAKCTILIMHLIQSKKAYCTYLNIRLRSLKSVMVNRTLMIR